ncbi:heme ABC exporter ATP-binding protein CcmA [Brevundimonas vitis]|uniref:Heme ABC exporter ATP-binding protein CcmA n=1 Tax=Brevundimonas vitisensis TaxID=2800818 RepID=A0ABX7BLK3_9CAUL|nr:heme ABC exporter ATP-binding protein CcmA [Brevundimonas vitisensis]QQQ17733.1 heme ABC exporter ATP-binding protein CcmA [Brevundimonas vitisensis]
MITALTLSGLSIMRGERLLFRDLSLSIRAGEAVALTGANGAGKTSLLRAVARFIRPEAGTIGFEGPDGALDAETVRGQHIHMLGHLDGLKGGRTAREELAFQAGWLGGENVDPAVAALGLEPLLDLEVRKLSAGQRRRLALARMIAAPRALWLLDEPLSPLDARWRERVGTMMQDHLKGGGVILAAVHDPLPIPARALDLGGGR